MARCGAESRVELGVEEERWEMESRRERNDTHSHLLLALVELCTARVGVVDVPSAFLFDLMGVREGRE